MAENEVKPVDSKINAVKDLALEELKVSNMELAKELDAREALLKRREEIQNRAALGGKTTFTPPAPVETEEDKTEREVIGFLEATGTKVPSHLKKIK